MKSIAVLAFSLLALVAHADVSDEIAHAKKAVQAKAEHKVMSLFQAQVKSAKLSFVEVKQTSVFGCQYGDYSDMDGCLSTEYQNGWSSNYDVKLSDGRVCNLTLWIQNRSSSTGDFSNGIACFKKAKKTDTSDLEFSETLSFDDLK